MKKYLLFTFVVVVLSTLIYPMLDDFGYAESNYVTNMLPYDNDALTYWNQAKSYKAQNRLELSRQSYLMALATCKTTVQMYQIKRELQAINLQIKTLR